MPLITLDTHAREEMLDITAQVQRMVDAAGLREGLCHLHCRHTTAGLTVNANADADVKHDLLMALSRIIIDGWPYLHSEGNSPAHVKSSLVGCQLSVPVAGGRLALGRWQGLLFCEFDGPRQGREVAVTFVPGFNPD